jgi:hypothetical protein
MSVAAPHPDVSFESADAPAARPVSRPPLPREQTQYLIATNLAQVLEAWSLVYEVYLNAGLINPNPRKLHFVPQAISPQTVVALRRAEGVAVSSISAYADGRNGLPLDCVYKQELDEMRARGRKLVEVGMLADSSDQRSSINGLARLMRYPFYFTLWSGWDDLVIGVHPHHVRFYEHMFGFRQAGPLKTYPVVRNHPVVLLALDVQRQWSQPQQPRGGQVVVDNPVDASVFAHRFQFDEQSIAHTPLALRQSQPLQHVA